MTSKSDNSIDPLVKYLGALKNEARIAIVQILSQYKRPLEYNEIQHELEDKFGITPNLSYHLNILKENLIITGDEKGYQLTEMGDKTRNFLRSVEEVVTPEAPIRIRTSKYSMEFFDESIIEKHLQEEAGMPLDIAKEIAIEAKQRLNKANITYLTAPLVREYINAILVEHHFENYRAKLTRLGLPPFDVKQLLISKHCSSPAQFQDILGRNVIEQFVLLNLLQQKYADAFLSGDFLFAKLSHFGISPVELVITGDQFELIILKYIRRFDYIKFNSSKNKSSKGVYIQKEDPIDISIGNLNLYELIQAIQSFFKAIKPFFPMGISIIRFDLFLERFLSQDRSTKRNQELYQLINSWSPYLSDNWKISLGVSLIANFVDIRPLFEIYANDWQHLQRDFSQSGIHLPNLVIHGQKSDFKGIQNASEFSKLSSFQQLLISILPHPQVTFDQFMKWGWPSAEHIYTNLRIPIAVEHYDQFKPAVILEKISINLLALYYKSNKNEKTFFKGLEKALFRVFDFFEYKYTLIRRNLPKFTNWQHLQEILFKSTSSQKNFLPKGCTIAAVSFHGMDEMVLMHTDLFIRMQTKNRTFAVKIMDFMQKLLDKQNFNENNPIHYVLAEAHPQKELLNPPNSILIPVDQKAQQLFQEPILHYRIGFHDPLASVPLSTIIKMYTELQASSFKELTIRYKLRHNSTKKGESIKNGQKTPLNKIEKYSEFQDMLVIQNFTTIQQLLAIKNCLLDLTVNKFAFLKEK
ncbi:anaerobic ribonucleoside-triphosphate reductase [Candidatus Harpocratesius sp.]